VGRMTYPTTSSPPSHVKPARSIAPLGSSSSSSRNFGSLAMRSKTFLLYSRCVWSTGFSFRFDKLECWSTNNLIDIGVLFVIAFHGYFPVAFANLAVSVEVEVTIVALFRAGQAPELGDTAQQVLGVPV